ncbi:MAG: hypothetical protein Q8R55_06390 [Candidatus Taylorbacteria bacterium]|nr:hypothetical protein [Candidatus Taylorbacteria bacterium]
MQGFDQYNIGLIKWEWNRLPDVFAASSRKGLGNVNRNSGPFLPYDPSALI